MKSVNRDKLIDEEYCVRCGKPVQLPRIDRKYIISEIGSVLSFKKGILFTIRELSIRPGKSIRTFILEDRNRLVKPVIFLIFCSFIYTIFQQLLGFEDNYFAHESGSQPTAIIIFQWMQGNWGYANILMAIFMALWIKILFRKDDYNFYEVLILLFFVVGVSMLIYALFGILKTITDLESLYFTGALVGLAYSSWAIGQFFSGRIIFNFIKALLSYFLGLILFGLAIVAIGYFADLIK